MHAPLSFSASSRWLSCTGSLAYDRDVTERSSNAAADAGTLMHEAAAAILTGNPPPELTEEQSRIVDEYCRQVYEICDEVGKNHTILIEQRVDYDPEHAWGTADCIIVSPYRIDVIDLKTGGNKVLAAGNTQLMCYAMSALKQFNVYPSPIRHKNYPMDVHMHIIQPSIDWTDTWELPVDAHQWTRLAGELDDAIWAFKRGEFNFVPNDSNCQYCKGNGSCKARSDQMHRLAAQDFTVKPPAPKDLGDAELARLLPHLDAVIKWCGDVQQHCIDRMTKGQPIPGFKLDQGPTQRRWADDQKVIVALLAAGVAEDVAVRRTPITIGTAEKLLGKKHRIFEEQCKRTEPRSIIVPDLDTQLSPAQLSLEFN